MSRKTPRLSYLGSDPKGSSSCHRYSGHNTISTLKRNNPTSVLQSSAPRRGSKLPKDLTLMLEHLELVEKRMQGRIHKMDALCRDFSAFPDDGISTGSSSIQEEDFEESLEVPSAIEVSFVIRNYIQTTEFCEIIAELVYKKLCEKKKQKTLLKKTKKGLVLTKKLLWEFIWPRIVLGLAIKN